MKNTLISILAAGIVAFPGTIAEAGIFQGLFGGKGPSITMPAKGVKTERVRSKAPTGGSAYTMERSVYDNGCRAELADTQDAASCESKSTIVAQINKDTDLQGLSVSATIDNKGTVLLIGAAVASADGSAQIRAKGDAMAIVIKTLLEEGADLATALQPASSALDTLIEGGTAIIRPPE